MPILIQLGALEEDEFEKDWKTARDGGRIFRQTQRRDAVMGLGKVVVSRIKLFLLKFV